MTDAGQERKLTALSFYGAMWPADFDFALSTEDLRQIFTFAEAYADTREAAVQRSAPLHPPTCGIWNVLNRECDCGAIDHTAPLVKVLKKLIKAANAARPWSGYIPAFNAREALFDAVTEADRVLAQLIK